MNKKIIFGILLLIFSTDTINLTASLPDKITSTKQKIKNFIAKVTLNDVLDYTFKAAVVVIGVAAIIERRQRKTEEDKIYKAINKQFFRINDLVNKVK